MNKLKRRKIKNIMFYKKEDQKQAELKKLKRKYPALFANGLNKDKVDALASRYGEEGADDSELDSQHEFVIHENNQNESFDTEQEQERRNSYFQKSKKNKKAVRDVLSAQVGKKNLSGVQSASNLTHL